MHIHPAHLFQKSVLLTDEGSAFPSVVEFFDWNHILDRHHFTQQIKSSWANLKKPEEFREDVIAILDACTVQLYKELMSAARTKYTTPKARDLLNKIKLYEGQLVYAFTSSHFTAGHISTNRSEGMMSAIKANGVLKKILRNAT